MVHPCLSLWGPIALRLRAKEDQEQQPCLCLLEGFSAWRREGYPPACLGWDEIWGLTLLRETLDFAFFGIALFPGCIAPSWQMNPLHEELGLLTSYQLATVWHPSTFWPNTSNPSTSQLSNTGPSPPLSLSQWGWTFKRSPHNVFLGGTGDTVQLHIHTAILGSLPWSLPSWYLVTHQL